MKTGNSMNQQSEQEYFRIIHARYQRAPSDAEKSQLLDELCAVCQDHRKHAIRKLHQPHQTRNFTRSFESPARRKPIDTRVRRAILALTWRFAP